MKKSHVILWLPCVFYYAFISFISHIPGDHLIPNLEIFPYFDKVVHFCLYAFLGLIVSRALSWEEYYHHLKRRWYIYFVLIVILAALIDEFHQYFVPFRNMDILDWMADVGGAIFGGGLYFFIFTFLKQNQKRGEAAFIEQEARGVGLILALVYFVVLISLNLFNHKEGLLHGYKNLSYVLMMLEYSVLGLLTIRFVYLKRGLTQFHVRDWLLFGVIGSIFVCLHQMSFQILLQEALPPREMFWLLLSFVLGALGYYFDQQIDKFRKKIFADPVYKRRTWQRVYFFLPPVVLLLVVSFISSQSPSILYNHSIPLPNQIFPESGPFSLLRNAYVLHIIQFFVFGVFYFRAITWESWWYRSCGKKWLWVLSCLLISLLAFSDEYLQSFVPDRVADWYDCLSNLMGVVFSMILYLFGYRVIKEKYYDKAQ